MQLYHGLPVITNKITDEEMKGVPHHLLGCIGLEQETWTVGKFVTSALGVVSTSFMVNLLNADHIRLRRFAAEASFLYSLVALTTTRSRCCSKMLCRKSLHLT